MKSLVPGKHVLPLLTQPARWEMWIWEGCLVFNMKAQSLTETPVLRRWNTELTSNYWDVIKSRKSATITGDCDSSQQLALFFPQSSLIPIAMLKELKKKKGKNKTKPSILEHCDIIFCPLPYLGWRQTKWKDWKKKVLNLCVFMWWSLSSTFLGQQLLSLNKPYPLMSAKKKNSCRKIEKEQQSTVSSKWFYTVANCRGGENLSMQCGEEKIKQKLVGTIFYSQLCPIAQRWKTLISIKRYNKWRSFCSWESSRLADLGER